MHPLIEQVNKSYYRKSKLPEFQPGDTVRVSINVKEGDKQRIQNFEGVVIARKGSGVTETFTVRRVSFGIGVERTFFFNSPVIQKLKVVRKGKVRRAKLYYLRGLGEKKARIQELITDQTVTDATATQQTEKEKEPTTKEIEPAATV